MRSRPVALVVGEDSSWSCEATVEGENFLVHWQAADFRQFAARGTTRRRFRRWNRLTSLKAAIILKRLSMVILEAVMVSEMFAEMFEKTHQFRVRNALHRANALPGDIDKIIDEEKNYLNGFGLVVDVLTFPKGTSDGKERFIIRIEGYVFGKGHRNFGVVIPLDQVELIVEARRAQSHKLGFAIACTAKPPNSYDEYEVQTIDWYYVFSNLEGFGLA